MTQQQFLKELMTTYKIKGPHELARQLGVSPSYVSKILCGHRKINDAIKFKIGNSFPSFSKKLIGIK